MLKKKDYTKSLQYQQHKQSDHDNTFTPHSTFMRCAMNRTILFLTMLSVFLIRLHRTSSYKSQEALKKQYNKAELQKLSTSESLVGKAMDFFYSNKTVMSLIARELWNVGAKAIDTIVDVKSEYFCTITVELCLPRTTIIESKRPAVDSYTTVERLHGRTDSLVSDPM